MVSAGSGPRASMPSARNCSTAGATTARSSSPSVPSSPACGFSPASARRGRAMPKRSRRSRATIRPVSTIRSVVSRARHVAHRQVNGHRHDGKLGRPQHHHRMRRASGVLLRELGEKFGVAGLGEAGAVEHRLGDRIGDDRVRAPGEHVGDRAADRRDRGRRARGVRVARLGGDLLGERDHRQRGREGAAPRPRARRRAAGSSSRAGARAASRKSGSASR